MVDFGFKDLQMSKDSSLSCYNGGIVTDDTYAADGIYTLDQVGEENLMFD